MQKELLLTTRLFEVERRVFPRVGQTSVRRDVVVHPGAVVILPVLEDGRLVLIRNYRYPVEKELLELAAGTREPDETPLETARRELEEETGYRAGVIEPLTEFYTSPGILTERMYAFLATDLTEVGQNLQGTRSRSRSRCSSRGKSCGCSRRARSRTARRSRCWASTSPGGTSGRTDTTWVSTIENTPTNRRRVIPQGTPRGTDRVTCWAAAWCTR